MGYGFGAGLMDNSTIRGLLAEWFGPRPGAVAKAADEDYAEAAAAIRALKSLFQTELDRRAQVLNTDDHDAQP